jgi:hypothetical protein
MRGTNIKCEKRIYEYKHHNEGEMPKTLLNTATALVAGTCCWIFEGCRNKPVLLQDQTTVITDARIFDGVRAIDDTLSIRAVWRQGGQLKK